MFEERLSSSLPCVKSLSARQQAEERVRREEAQQAARRVSEFQTTVNEALCREERIRRKIALGLLIVF